MPRRATLRRLKIQDGRRTAISRRVFSDWKRAAIAFAESTRGDRPEVFIRLLYGTSRFARVFKFESEVYAEFEKGYALVTGLVGNAPSPTYICRALFSSHPNFDKDLTAVCEEIVSRVSHKDHPLATASDLLIDREPIMERLTKTMISTKNQFSPTRR